MFQSNTVIFRPYHFPTAVRCAQARAWSELIGERGKGLETRSSGFSETRQRPVVLAFLPLLGLPDLTVPGGPTCVYNLF